MKKFWILILVLTAGCATTEKKAKSYYLNNKDKLAELCMDCFPVKQDYIKGKDIYLPSDTVFIKGDSVVVQGACPDGTKVNVKCPPSDTLKVYIPIMRIDTITKVDSAAIFYWQKEFKKSDIEKNKLVINKASLEQDKKDWRKWAFIFGGIIAIYIGFKLFRYIKPVLLKGLGLK